MNELRNSKRDFISNLKEGYMNIKKRYMKIKKFHRNIIVTFFFAFLCFFMGLLLIFLFAQYWPGDPVAAYLAALGIHKPTYQQYQQMTKQLGVDNFFLFIKALFNGSWRISTSLSPNALVTDLIGDAMLNMIELIIIPLVIGVSIGIFLGSKSNRNRGTRKNRAIQLYSIFGLSLPVFFLGMIVNYFLCYEIGICDPTGFSFIPIVILTFSISAFVSWQIRSPRRGKPCTKSLVTNTMLIGSGFSFIFMFYMVIEEVFDMNGLGALLIDSFYSYDYFLNIGCLFVILLIFTLTITISNLIFSYSKHKTSESSEPKLDSTLIERKYKHNEDDVNLPEGSVRDYFIKKLKTPIGIVSTVLIIIFILIGFFPQLITHYSYLETITPNSGAWDSPSLDHPLGKTYSGLDVLALIIWGIQDLFVIGFGAVGLGFMGGLIFGLLVRRYNKEGYKLVMGIMFLFYIFPGFLFIIILAPILQFFIPSTSLYIGILLIPGFTQVISKNRSKKVNRKEILKEIIIHFPFSFAIAIIIYTALGFLGLTQFMFIFDPEIQIIQLGLLIRWGGLFLSGAPWASLWPGLVVFGLVFSFFLSHINLRGFDHKLNELKELELE